MRHRHCSRSRSCDLHHQRHHDRDPHNTFEEDGRRWCAGGCHADDEDAIHQANCPLYRRGRKERSRSRGKDQKGRTRRSHRDSERVEERAAKRKRDGKPSPSTALLPREGKHTPMESFFHTIEANFAKNSNPIHLYRSLLYESVLRNAKLTKECKALQTETEAGRQRERAYNTYVEALEKMVGRLAKEKLEAQRNAREDSINHGRHARQRKAAGEKKSQKPNWSQYAGDNYHEMLKTKEANRDLPELHHDRDTGALPACQRQPRDDVNTPSRPIAPTRQGETLRDFYSKGQSPFSRSPHDGEVGNVADELQLDSVDDEKCTSEPQHSAGGILADADDGAEELRQIPPIPVASRRPQPRRASPLPATKAPDEAELVDELLALMQHRAQRDQQVVSKLMREEDARRKRKAISGDEGLRDNDSLANAEAEPELRALPVAKPGATTAAARLPRSEPPLSRQELFRDLGLVSTGVSHGPILADNAAHDDGHHHYHKAIPHVDGNIDSNMRNVAATAATTDLAESNEHIGAPTKNVVGGSWWDNEESAAYSSDGFAHDDGSDEDSVDDSTSPTSAASSPGQSGDERDSGRAGHYPVAYEDNGSNSEEGEREDGEEEIYNEEDFSREFDEWKQRLEELLSTENTPVRP